MNSMTYKDISERYESKGILITTQEEKGLEGEYKNYEFIVDENKNVIIGKKLEGKKPTIITGTAIDSKDGKMKVQIITDGEVQSIEPINGGTLVFEYGNNKIFEVTENGTYKFKVIGTNGRVAIAKVVVNNSETIEADSLLDGSSSINSSGTKKIKMAENKIEYSVNTIIYEGDLILDGKTQLVGSILNNNLYEFGSTADVATASSEAKNTVILKVNGNLTINGGVTLTACKSNSGYGGPKGLIVYCTGIFTNNGTVNMSARGAKATGQNVYLWKNGDDSFEYIPATGASGGARVPGPYNGSGWGYAAGKVGGNGSARRTGGGGSGGSSCKTTATTGFTSGRGGNGTSYSGGSGGGAADKWYSGGYKGSGRN